VETSDQGDHVREKWYLWTEPDYAQPFYLLNPRRRARKIPLAICPHGHNKKPEVYAGVTYDAAEEKDMRDNDRDVGRQAVREGCLAVVPIVRGFGETARAKDVEEGAYRSCRVLLMHGLLQGRTVVGQRVWDMQRLLDWALSRDDVDGSRVVITGNSGGGTITLFTAAVEPRICVAVPGSYFCTFAGSIGSVQHCECNYVPGILRLGEMHDVAGLIAPRPFMAVNGEKDEIFPIAHVREAFSKLQEIYRIFGAEGQCELYVGPAGHRYYKAGAWPFIRRWLRLGR
jgi:fermentation-respiration switch protein FrsA (DUF1100 family)